jgi:TPR repeat protein
MADAGIRFLVEVDVSRDSWAYSFSGGAEWYKQTGISAHVLDVASGEVSGPAMALVAGHGGSLLVIGVTPVTEGPACARVAAFLASSVTATPLSVIAPDLAPLAERERLREAAGLEGWLTACNAAVAGNAKEMSRVGFYFLNGNPPIGFDKIEAYTWFLRASEAGYRDAEAMAETMPTGFSEEERVAAEARVASEAPDGNWCRAVAGAS